MRVRTGYSLSRFARIPPTMASVPRGRLMGIGTRPLKEESWSWLAGPPTCMAQRGKGRWGTSGGDGGAGGGGGQGLSAGSALDRRQPVAIRARPRARSSCVAFEPGPTTHRGRYDNRPKPSLPVYADCASVHQSLAWDGGHGPDPGRGPTLAGGRLAVERIGRPDGCRTRWFGPIVTRLP